MLWELSWDWQWRRSRSPQLPVPWPRTLNGRETLSNRWSLWATDTYPEKKIDFWQWSTAIPLCLTYKHHCPILPRLLPNGVGGNKKRIQTFEWCVLKITALHCTWRHDTNRLHVPATSLRKTVLALIHGSRKRHGSACSDFVQTRLWRSHWYL